MASIRDLRGSIVALVTPMSEKGEIDFEGLETLINWHISAGTNGLVLCGTTGEAATMSDDEWEKVISKGVEISKKRILLIAGTGTNNTKLTIEKTKKAKKIGCDGALIVTPYYNKPTQEGLFQHYMAISEAVDHDFPIILYNVPGRTCCDMSVDTVKRLSLASKNFIAVKEASGKIEKYGQLKKECGKDFLVYSGEDDQSCDAMLRDKIDGVISVTANVAPELMMMMTHYALSNDEKNAKEVNSILEDLHKNLFIETNPIPTKWCLYNIKKIKTSQVRLPLVSLSKDKYDHVENAYKKMEKFKDSKLEIYDQLRNQKMEREMKRART